MSDGCLPIQSVPCLMDVRQSSQPCLMDVASSNRCWFDPLRSLLSSSWAKYSLACCRFTVSLVNHCKPLKTIVNAGKTIGKPLVNHCKPIQSVSCLMDVCQSSQSHVWWMSANPVSHVWYMDVNPVSFMSDGCLQVQSVSLTNLTRNMVCMHCFFWTTPVGHQFNQNN